MSREGYHRLNKRARTNRNKEIARLRERGLTYKALAKLFGLCENAIGGILRGQGITGKVVRGAWNS